MKKENKKHSLAAFEFGNLTHVGMARSDNQDYYGRYDGDFGHLIIVCDGMGGYQGGEIASRLAVEAFKEHFQKLRTNYDPRFELEQAFHMANQRIDDHKAKNPETANMGTTVILLLIRGIDFWFANLGDSRLYLKRSGQTLQLSKDHSVVQEMVDNGILSPEQAIDHPKRNMITRALGAKNTIPDIFGPHRICENDVFMLCSDGLYEYFDITELNEILKQEPQQACKELVDKANQRGGSDNITVQVLRSNIGEAASSAKLIFMPDIKTLPWKYVILVILIIASVLLFFSYRMLSKKVILRKASDSTAVADSSGKPSKDSINTSPTAEAEDKQSSKDKSEQGMKEVFKPGVKAEDKQKTKDPSTETETQKSKEPNSVKKTDDSGSKKAQTDNEQKQDQGGKDDEP